MSVIKFFAEIKEQYMKRLFICRYASDVQICIDGDIIY